MAFPATRKGVHDDPLHSEGEATSTNNVDLEFILKSFNGAGQIEKVRKMMKIQSISLKMLKAVELLVYVILIALAAFFVSGMIKEYLEENTSFSITQKSMTKEDLPTVTICFKSQSSAVKMRYGRDLIIQTIDSKHEPWLLEANTTIRTLVEGNNDNRFMGLKRQTTLEQLRVKLE